MLCLNPGTVIYTTVGITDVEPFIWSVFPEEAGIVSCKGAEATIGYVPEFIGTCEIKVKGVNDCCEGNWSTALGIWVWSTPDPLEPPVGSSEVCAGEPEVVY